MRTLSPLAAGTMNWGVWDKNLSTGAMSDLIRVCIENNITTFDHADIYGGYTTEAEFGDAFRHSGAARDSVEFISKCGIQHVSGRTNRIKHYDYSEDYIIWSVENSLKHLKTEFLDVLLLHRPSPLMQADEISAAVEKLKSAGKILSFGVSNFTTAQTELINRAVKVDYNQIEFSATNVEPMTDGSLDYMQINGIRPMAWSPLGSVFKMESEQSQRIKIVLSLLKEKYDANYDILLLAWILRHPSGIVPICGTADPDRIRNLRKAVEIKLEVTDWFEIWEASRGTKVP